MKFWISPIPIPILILFLTSPLITTHTMVAFTPHPNQNNPLHGKNSHKKIAGLPFPSLSDLFRVIEHPSKRGATVLEAPVAQDGVELYIAIDSDSFGHVKRPGNGGIRMLNYKSSQQAIDDAVRLAKGMTHKHDMFR